MTKLFTLSGGHLFSLYDGCREEGIDLVDTRHEQAAAFAAEGWAKVTRSPGVAALTAGPGVTNGMSPLGSAQMNNSPLVVLGGRAPAMRWGMGSLQEIDHVPFVRPLTKMATTAQTTADIPGLIDDALATALRPHSGPTFVDLPLDVVFSEAPEGEPGPALPNALDEPAAADGMERAIALLRDAERPVIMAGTNLWWGHGEEALKALVRERRIPVFLNGMARGCVPADDELFFSRARGAGLSGADVAIVIGVPMDFRLGFGGAFGDDTGSDRGRPRGGRARPPARGRGGAYRRDRGDARRTARGQRRTRGRDRRMGRRAARDRGREARRRERGPRGRARAAASDAHLRGAQRVPRSRRDRDRRRRRLRLLRGPRDQLLRARLLARPGPVRLPRLGSRLRAGRQARAPRSPGRAAARRRRLRLQRDGVRHARPARRERRRRDGQQRHLGAGEAPDGVPLRLLGDRRPAARHALRPDGRGAGMPRRARRAPGRPARCARARVRSRPPGARQRAPGPGRDLPAQGEPGVMPPGVCTAPRGRRR